MKNTESNIIADGSRLHRKTLKQRVSLEVRQRHDEELRQATFWRRFWLEIKIRREIAVAVNKEFPPAALHWAKLS
jgi:hypothetical protein